MAQSNTNQFIWDHDTVQIYQWNKRPVLHILKGKEQSAVSYVSDEEFEGVFQETGASGD